MLFTIALPSTVSRMPSSVGMESFKISSVPLGWTRTATVPESRWKRGVSTLATSGFVSA